MAHREQGPITIHRMPVAIAATLALSFAPIALSIVLLLVWRRFSGVDVDVIGLLVFLLVLRWINVFTVSAGLHRGASHKHFEWHPALEKIVRVWNFWWAASTRVWAIMHRAHHAETDGDFDPHSPNKAGGSLWNILAQTSRSYIHVARNLDAYARYDVGLPNDRWERFTVWVSQQGMPGIILSRVPVVLLALALVFGLPVAVCLLPGVMFSIWTGTILVINGFAHRYGYRAFATGERSTNLFPIDLLGLGELLHHNHHAFPGRANLALQRWELDPLYLGLRALQRVRLVRALRR